MTACTGTVETYRLPYGLLYILLKAFLLYLSGLSFPKIVLTSRHCALCVVSCREGRERGLFFVWLWVFYSKQFPWTHQCSAPEQKLFCLETLPT